ncbi:hypothetical protein ACTJKK_02420 [Microbacterium sp. 22179]|uniref:hypothetical protein n=1 Tax=Microbacterium sp. 22179 TaxID=3453886 RepID=UPI003F857431
MSKFNPSSVVTVGALEVGDTIFLRERRVQAGLPIPTHPVIVTELVPFADGRVQVAVRNTNAASSVPARFIGYLPASREFRRAVEELV